MIAGRCSECGETYAVTGDVQVAVKDHTTSCREIQALDQLVNGGGSSGYRALDERHPLGVVEGPHVR